MTATKDIASVEDFIKKIDIIPNDCPSSVYRGEGQKFKEPCKPKLFRKVTNSIKPDIFNGFRDEIHRVEKWFNAISLSEGKVPQVSGDFEKLALAQHYGVTTRLLDWTLNPLVALWFACFDSDGNDGYIYSYNPVVIDLSFVKEEILRPFPSDRYNAISLNPFGMENKATIKKQAVSPFKDVHFFQPKNFPDARLVSQSAVLSIHPNDKHDVTSQLTFKIPAAKKELILRELDIFGINIRSMGMATRDRLAELGDRKIT
ncbi:MAG: FRG domain-containing protein [Arenicellales bacterium]